MRRFGLGVRLAAAGVAAVVLALATYGAVDLARPVMLAPAATIAAREVTGELCQPTGSDYGGQFVAGPQTMPADIAFDRSTVIDNRYLPMRPGTQLIYSGQANVDGVAQHHRVVFTVTDLVKLVAGIPNVVLLELDYSDGVLDEAELAFFAQANDGSVWHFGQYPQVYEGGVIIDSPAWLHGFAGAHAGIAMKAAPRLGAPSYSQGWGPEVGWVDRAIVHDTDRRVCVPAGCYDGVLVMDEFDLEAPDAHQLKFYAPGIGGIRVGWYGSDDTQESLELVQTRELTAAELARVRADALRLEASAYQRSKDVYARTQPMTPRG